MLFDGVDDTERVVSELRSPEYVSVGSPPELSFGIGELPAARTDGPHFPSQHGSETN